MDPADTNPTPHENGVAEPRNPLLRASGLPFDMPDFSAVTPDLLRDALDEGIEIESAAWQQILETEGPVTVENTIEALAHARVPLGRAVTLMHTLASSTGNQKYLDLEAEYLPVLAIHDDEFWLEPRMYYRFRSLDRAQELLDLSEDHLHFVHTTIKRFRLGGIELDYWSRGALAEMNAHLAGLEADFGQRVIRAGLRAAVEVEGDAALEGIDEDTRAALRTEPTFGSHAASPRTPRGVDAQARPDEHHHYLIPLQNTTQQQIASRIVDAELREDLLHASTSRCGQTAFGTEGPRQSTHAGGDIVNDSDTRSTLLEIARLRAARAQVLGLPDHASVVAGGNDAGTTSAIDALLDRIGPPARAQADAEIASFDTNEEVRAADVTFHYARLRAQQAQVDDDQLRPYLELWTVLEMGVFYAATRLYGVTFVEREDLPVYAPDVSVWEVREADGSPLGLFIGDFYAREGKRGGAWMHALVEQSHLLGTKPVICNNANFRKPAQGAPTLLSWDEVRTLFHEFGHALHGLLSDVHLPQQSGTSVQRDTVEYPSQVNEMWQAHPEVLANYARHWETGEQMPEELIARLEDVENVTRGFTMLEHFAAVVLDQGWHRVRPEELPDDPAGVDRIEHEILARAGLDHPLVPPRYRSSYFLHTFGGGYDAGYYSYLWAEQLDADTAAWFRTVGARGADGGLNRTAGARFRSEVLSRGGTRDMSASFRALRGRDVSPEPLLQRHGLFAH